MWSFMYKDLLFLFLGLVFIMYAMKTKEIYPRKEGFHFC